MTRLRIVLWIVAVSQLILGGLTLFAPAFFFELIGLATPPDDNRYIIGMLGARFLAYGIGFVVLARRTRPDLFWVWNMVAIQSVDLALGAFYTARGTLELATSAFPMVNATLFAVLLAAFAWPMRNTTAR
ncbi:MAG: hypothetical protein Q8L54_00405 [Devosia sp.]|nr:hypothetical protein [Devosia sp.]